VIFSKAAGWTKAKSSKWLQDHSTEGEKYFTDGYDETTTSHRWRQYDPQSNKFRYRNEVIEEEDGKPSITLVLGFPKGSKANKEIEAMKEQGIFLRVDGAENGEAVIDIHGEIGWDIWGEALRDMINALGKNVTRVIFDIYSPGGSVLDGNWMVNLIGEMEQHTVARVQVAASMATVIAVSCDDCEMAKNGRWLVHNPWSSIVGDHTELEKHATLLKDLKDQIAAFYAQRIGGNVDEISDLMDEERWMNAEEAHQWGFIDTVVDPFDVAAFADMNSQIEAAGKWPVALVLEKEEPDEGTDTGGAEGVGEDGNANASESAEGDQEAEETEGQDGETGTARLKDEGPPTVEMIGAKLLSALETIKALEAKETELRAELVKERNEMARKDAEHKTTIAAKDAQLQDLGERILRLTPAMADSSESTEHVITTWAQAIEECGNDPDGLAEAREKYPELYKEQREQDKANRKGTKK
jgi:ATP-dependent Clp protease protease subunit